MKNLYRQVLRILLCAAVCACTASCATDEEPEGDITGSYGRLTESSDTVITIGKTSGGYSLRCTYEDFNELTSYTWQGTFSRVPTDEVKDSQGRRIGEITVEKGTATFRAETQRPGTYRGYRDELADLPRSRSHAADSLQALPHTDTAGDAPAAAQP